MWNYFWVLCLDEVNPCGTAGREYRPFPGFPGLYDFLRVFYCGGVRRPQIVEYVVKT